MKPYNWVAVIVLSSVLMACTDRDGDDHAHGAGTHTHDNDMPAPQRISEEPDHGHSHDDGEHGHGDMTSEKASQKAVRKLADLIDHGKLDRSWEGRMPERVEKKAFAKGPEWVVSFRNDSIADTSQQTLYIFFTLDGRYIASNFSGN